MKIALPGLVSVVALVCGSAHAQSFPYDIPHLVEEAADAGVDHIYSGPWEFFVGGGVASFDCNGDRLPDLFLAGGSGEARLFVNQSSVGGPLKFVESDLAISTKHRSKVLGAYPLDIDNDDHTDLIVLRLGENLILKGGPDCSFDLANKTFRFDGGTDWSTAFSAIWEQESVYPTLAFGHYVDRSAPGTPWGTCTPNQLLRPSTDTELPGYAEPIALEPGYCALSLMFTDWNKSGQPSLRVTNDRQYYRGGQEQLWRIDPGRPPRQYSKSQGWKPLRIWGMGIAQADLDQDGHPEYALSSMGDTMLQTLDPDADEERPTYRDAAFEKQMTAHRPYTGTDLKPSTGWHTQFADFNNDTHLDLFIAKGNVEAMPDFAAFDPDNMLMGNGAGGFTEVGEQAGIALGTRGRGATVTDLNADGMLDLVVVNRNDKASVFRNLGQKTDWGHRPMGNWVALELNNGRHNRSAIGATISVKTGNLTQSHVVQIGGGHASGQSGFIHFGLGVAERAKIRVRWPDGDWSHEYRVFANNFIQINRQSPEALYWYPDRSDPN
ncbi:MAG: CRTAC1 family protein [Granulosicoccus sp.]|nr:CRTAC1 family protein [Granulosicoccus sp.]